MEESHSVFEHSKFKDIECSGVKNKSQMKKAFMVYLDLCEVKEWWNVRLHPCEELDLVFLSGHSARHEPRELILPMAASENVTVELLQMYLNTIQLEDYDTKGLTLAICDTDSTVVYYKVTDGLVKPQSPEDADAAKQQKIMKYRKRRTNVLAAVDEYYEEKKSKHFDDVVKNESDDLKNESDKNVYYTEENDPTEEL